MEQGSGIEKTIFCLLSPPVAAILRAAPAPLLAAAGEIRLRAQKPLLLAGGDGDFFLTPAGRPTESERAAYIATVADLAKTLQLISRNSLYAFEEELRLGYITVAGGHRIGLAGQAVVAGGEIRALKNVSALNIRLAREVRGAADPVIPYLVDGPRQVKNTLVIPPPGCGKTTLLRDLARQLSSGVPRLGLAGQQVGVVDERSELAACQDGIPTADLGPRADVLDGCPKSQGMLMLIRAMGSRVIVTDELGREGDAMAIREARHAGVAVVASAHGRSVADIAGRPHIGALVAEGCFDRFVILGSPPVGAVQEIAAGDGAVLYRRRGVRVCG